MTEDLQHPSRQLIEEALRNPSKWIYDIDYQYPRDQPVPSEAIRGAWEVDTKGTIVGSFSTNARYRPIETSHRQLKPYMHAGARFNPDQWVTEIDERGESMFPDVPTHLIRGWWYVDKDGKITNKFRPNSLWIGEAK